MVFLVSLVSLIFVALGSRIACLHAGAYAGKIEDVIAQRRFEKSLDVERGRVFDSTGKLLALDVVKKAAWADPGIMAEKNADEKAAEFFAECMNLDRGELMASFGDPDRRFVYIGGYGTTIDEHQAQAVREMALPGVYLEDAYVRSYPLGSSMCHVLGYVNLERCGSSGIEQAWDERMRGLRGFIAGELDGKRDEIYDLRSIEIKPRRGCDLELTIDHSVQYIVEEALEKAIAENEALAAWAVVENVKTGEIIAMANLPAYDPNDFRKAKSDNTRNRCISDVYEPGSTFKTIVVASAIDAGVVAPSHVFDCENGTWIYERRPLRDYHPYGNLSVADIIKKSSNIGAAKIALLLGEKRIYDQLRLFGIGSPTGIELPGEEGGILRTTSNWTKLSPTRIAMGHEVAVTALQMVNAMATIVNGGVMMKPYIVKRAISADGTVFFEGKPSVVSHPISPETAETMKNLLVRTTEEGGTGRRAAVEGYTVGGKTGTSQKLVGGRYSDVLNVASFVGFIPAEDPELAIIIVVDEPRKNARTGGAVAAPVFKEIAEQTVRRLNIMPPVTVARARSLGAFGVLGRP
jgi:cell division protein FtsI (penicillin-binding protein 3)